ncbi:MAG: cytochrome c oxidase subunit 3 [Alphaproteobacteria bacterium]
MAHAEVKHDYHLVEPSPWPIVGAASAFVLAIGAITAMKGFAGDKAAPLVHFFFGKGQPVLLALGALMVAYTMFSWWRDVIKESREGFHTQIVQIGLRYGMILFIASEVMFFVAWFWAFFSPALFPHDSHQVMRTDFVGGVWPPHNVRTFDPWHLPLTNTLILLTSGTTVTWAHHAIQHGNRRGLVWGLGLTILLGMSFTALQAIEYSEAGFKYGGNVYGAAFFMATGFHGAHVIIGTIFLAVCFFRALAGQFTPTKHFGLEAAAWYWHFVDVVWLFLFSVIYVFWAGTPAHG